MTVQRKPFYIWLIEKLWEYGDSSGGMGWMIYWLAGFVSLALLDVIVLHTTGSRFFFGYLGLTILYLIGRKIRHVISLYYTETEETKK